MATLNLGRIKPVFRGAYNNSTAYVVDDIVTSSGSSYICIQASTGNAVSNATYWTQMAAGGTDVGTTITTQGDILYRDGSGLQRLAAGTSGQYLETRGSGQNPVWSTVSSPIKKSYLKMFRGGQSMSGFSAATPAEVPNYNLTITPISTSSVFLATYNLSIGSAGDHTFIQAVAKTGSGSYQRLGTGKSSFFNSNQYFDFGSFYVGGDSNRVTNSGHSFYYAPSTTSNITFGLYAGQHSNTAYFGRTFNSHNSDDYTALGMTIRVDEYASSSDLSFSEYSSG